MMFRFSVFVFALLFSGFASAATVGAAAPDFSLGIAPFTAGLAT